uniref:Exocyst complex component Sec3 PIP2-binding N-terminal domain-containing protein n=1 Tax=Callorhinchus milii TaxID=7868 RepID=A0A4W3IJV6_CALMI
YHRTKFTYPLSNLFQVPSENLPLHSKIIFSDHYFLITVTNCQDVQITFVKIMTSNQNEQYEKVNTWHLKDLKLLDGKEADEDNPHFEMHFDKIYNWEASSTASKYAFLRCLLELNNIYLGEEIVFVNFDTNYLYENSATINKGDCLLVMNLCVLYFCNCVLLKQNCTLPLSIS